MIVVFAMPVLAFSLLMLMAVYEDHILPTRRGPRDAAGRPPAEPAAGSRTIRHGDLAPLTPAGAGERRYRLVSIPVRPGEIHREAGDRTPDTGTMGV